MLRLDFSVSDLNLPATRDKTRRASISGVQDKVQLKRMRGKYVVVESGGDYILKPVPRNTFAELASDIPANEAVTMDIAGRIFGITVAEHELVEMQDGEKAYLTRRFDRRNGEPIQQEDFCQLAGRSPETHGENYKYDASYEELAELMRRFCPAAAVENPKVFFILLFNYVFANGDAHLKNFSLYRSEQGDYVLTPAYDLLNTSVHSPANRPPPDSTFSRTGISRRHTKRSVSTLPPISSSWGGPSALRRTRCANRSLCSPSVAPQWSGCSRNRRSPTRPGRATSFASMTD